MLTMIPYRNRSLANRNDTRDFFNPFADDFFRSFFGQNTSMQNFRVDVEDKGDHYLLQADLPGVAKENVKVEVENGVLTISANQEEKTEQKERNYICRERRCGTVSRSFNLEGVKEEDVAAEYHDGVLSLTLPKLTESAPATRHIEIH